MYARRCAALYPISYCSHQQPIKLSPNWISQAYTSPKKPFVVDVGCSKGIWTTEYATAHPDKNVLGLDIRQPVIDIALARKNATQLGNVHFLKSNANVDIHQILAHIEDSESAGVELIAIQFPDPYFKSRQHKRRLVNEHFVQNIIRGKVALGTKIFLQTDVEELMIAMIEVLQRSSHLVSLVEGQSYTDTFLNPAPYNLPTERELSCRESGNELIYRVMVKTIASTTTSSNI